MNSKDLNGKYIQFTKQVEVLETSLEENMIAKVINAQNNSDIVLKLQLDIESFTEYNKSFMTANYYDKGGQPRLTAIEAEEWANDTFYFTLEAPEFIVLDHLPMEATEEFIHVKVKQIQDLIASGELSATDCSANAHNKIMEMALSKVPVTKLQNDIEVVTGIHKQLNGKCSWVIIPMGITNDFKIVPNKSTGFEGWEEDEAWEKANKVIEKLGLIKKGNV